MIAPRWRKVLGDARAARGRLIGLGIAMAVSMAALVAILSSHAVLTRELQDNYTNTNPASAELYVDAIDASLLAAIEQRSDIAAAEASASLFCKIEVKPGEWLPIVLFVVSDFANQRISKFYPDSGQWPPSTGSILIERSGEPLMHIEPGAAATIELPNGERRSMRIAGTVHDPGQAPSWQEIAFYGYITPETLAQLDPSRQFDTLELTVAPEQNTIDRIDGIARSVATWLQQQGRAVRMVSIPKPNTHPHQWQIDTVLALLLGFSLLALVLEAVLLAIVIGGILAPQTRQIGVMKAVGARTQQVASLYLILVGVVALIALLVGVPSGLVAGNALTQYVARLLNFGIADSGVPALTLATCIALGLFVPLAAAFAPVWSAARRSVRESIDSFGVDKSSVGHGPVASTMRRVRVANPGVQLALRNALRRQSRFILTLMLLALAGTIFIVGGNFKAVWENVGIESAGNRRYDFEIALREPVAESQVLPLIRAEPQVLTTEPIDNARAFIDRGDGLMVARADQRYLQLVSRPVSTQLVAFTMSEGRWLDVSDTDAVVINSTARANVFPDVKLGETIALLVNRKPMKLRLVGVAREVFGTATAYTTPGVLDTALDEPSMTRIISVRLQAGAPVRATADKLKEVLKAQNIEVRAVWTNENVQRSVDAHTYMLIAVLGIIVAAVAVVGAMGLSSAMSTSVIERTREFGILRAIGARSRDIRIAILGEAMLIGAVSWLFAVIAANPLSLVVMNILRKTSPIALQMVWSPAAYIGWFAIVLIVAAIASLAPAARAARLTIRETLACQ